ncbi:ABC transporter ATP-binding protein [Methanobrevibacter ruminantium M1]|uniref:ABC transporter ATP-binding protein n=1 Tax=Methanobrevibacter ruminantium (strain ATCC 35063 / DSM 1093 / JCM 13430 / OCM 146 / M1) TaxID=634498 RepID=D3DZ01_METRM|nr:ABC transporter ATP-binding protein [Methanobrevibacter ruminantium]ADC47551.1 ABC transporter ATP-binding protein [Methanobrevibacter ruminantium M1]
MADKDKIFEDNAYDDSEYIYNDTYEGSRNDYDVEYDESEDYEYEEPLISLFDIVKEYDKGKVIALNKVNLDIYEGEFVSIIGPSGSGKSTLLNMLGALDVPTSGEIFIDGLNIGKEKDLSDFRRETIGFVFQLHNLIPNLSVWDNVQIPLVGTGLPEKEMKKRANEMIDAVGLSDKKKQKPNKLSGGERQRVAIARALVNKPSIILADEPTGSLDTKTGSMVLNLLRAMHDVYNVTLIVVTHDMEVARMADRMITIKDGQIVKDVDNF